MRLIDQIICKKESKSFSTITYNELQRLRNQLTTPVQLKLLDLMLEAFRIDDNSFAQVMLFDDLLLKVSELDEFDLSSSNEQNDLLSLELAHAFSERIFEKLIHEVNPFNLTLGFSIFYNNPIQFLGLIDALFKKQISQEALLTSGVLHQFAAMNIHTTKIIPSCYQLLVKLNNNYQRLVDEITDYSSQTDRMEQVSLTGETKQKPLIRIPLTQPTFVFTDTSENIACLELLFSPVFYNYALQSFKLNEPTPFVTLTRIIQTKSVDELIVIYESILREGGVNHIELSRKLTALLNEKQKQALLISKKCSPWLILTSYSTEQLSELAAQPGFTSLNGIVEIDEALLNPSLIGHIIRVLEHQAFNFIPPSFYLKIFEALYNQRINLNDINDSLDLDLLEDGLLNSDLDQTPFLNKLAKIPLVIEQANDYFKRLTNKIMESISSDLTPEAFITIKAEWPSHSTKFKLLSSVLGIKAHLAEGLYGLKTFCIEQIFKKESFCMQQTLSFLNEHGDEDGDIRILIECLVRTNIQELQSNIIQYLEKHYQINLFTHTFNEKLLSDHALEQDNLFLYQYFHQTIPASFNDQVQLLKQTCQSPTIFRFIFNQLTLADRSPQNEMWSREHGFFIALLLTETALRVFFELTPNDHHEFFIDLMIDKGRAVMQKNALNVIIQHIQTPAYLLKITQSFPGIFETLVNQEGILNQILNKCFHQSNLIENQDFVSFFELMCAMNINTTFHARHPAQQLRAQSLLTTIMNHLNNDDERVALLKSASYSSSDDQPHFLVNAMNRPGSVVVRIRSQQPNIVQPIFFSHLAAPRHPHRSMRFFYSGPSSEASLFIVDDRFMLEENRREPMAHPSDVTNNPPLDFPFSEPSGDFDVTALPSPSLQSEKMLSHLLKYPSVLNALLQTIGSEALCYNLFLSDNQDGMSYIEQSLAYSASLTLILKYFKAYSTSQILSMFDLVYKAAPYNESLKILINILDAHQKLIDHLMPYDILTLLNKSNMAPDSIQTILSLCTTDERLSAILHSNLLKQSITADALIALLDMIGHDEQMQLIHHADDQGIPLFVKYAPTFLTLLHRLPQDAFLRCMLLDESVSLINHYAATTATLAEASAAIDNILTIPKNDLLDRLVKPNKMHTIPFEALINNKPLLCSLLSKVDSDWLFQLLKIENQDQQTYLSQLIKLDDANVIKILFKKLPYEAWVFKGSNGEAGIHHVAATKNHLISLLMRMRTHPYLALQALKTKNACNQSTLYYAVQNEEALEHALYYYPLEERLHAYLEKDHMEQQQNLLEFTQNPQSLLVLIKKLSLEDQYLAVQQATSNSMLLKLIFSTHLSRFFNLANQLFFWMQQEAPALFFNTVLPLLQQSRESLEVFKLSDNFGTPQLFYTIKCEDVFTALLQCFSESEQLNLIRHKNNSGYNALYYASSYGVKKSLEAILAIYPAEEVEFALNEAFGEDGEEGSVKAFLEQNNAELFEILERFLPALTHPIPGR